MQKITLIIVISVLSLFSNAWGDSVSKRTALEDYFKGSDEPNVIDALWTDKTFFKVGMISNGSNRDGFAQYVCLILYQKGFKGEGVLVRVIDYPQLVDTGEWVNMGTALCK